MQRFNIKIIYVFLYLFCFQQNLYAQEGKGLEIIKVMDKHNTGWRDSCGNLKMILESHSGKISNRTLRIKNLEVMNDGDKSLIVFDEPKDIRGTGFLTFSHTVDQDDQWIYLPAIKRVKRISSANKSGPFMGSEFAYEDLSSFEIEKYTYTYIRDDVFADEDVFIVEMIPKYENSGYSRQISWIDKREYRILKTEYYDRKDITYKTLINSDFRLYLNSFWRPHTLVMKNHQKNTMTTLIFEKIKFNNHFTSNTFNRNSLKRIR